ncbi:hypothetical protein SAMN04490240_1848 [Rhodococcus pyridinivorans]|nr:hypothetical protein SAMN04490240_1848 [Rhodococcus pyridinivorans]
MPDPDHPVVLACPVVVGAACHPSPASPGSGCPQLRYAAATAQRRRSFTSARLHSASWRTRSPSQWPGTARSSTSAGRSLIITIGSTNRLVPSSGEQRRFRACPCATRSSLIDLDTLHGLSPRHPQPAQLQILGPCMDAPTGATTTRPAEPIHTRCSDRHRADARPQPRSRPHPSTPGNGLSTTWSSPKKTRWSQPPETRGVATTVRTRQAVGAFPVGHTNRPTRTVRGRGPSAAPATSPSDRPASNPTNGCRSRGSCRWRGCPARRGGYGGCACSSWSPLR